MQNRSVIQIGSRVGGGYVIRGLSKTNKRGSSRMSDAGVARSCRARSQKAEFDSPRRKTKKKKGGSKAPKAGNDNASLQDGYTRYGKDLYNSIDITGNQRCQSAKPINVHGLNYKFKVIDLGKYRDKLKYGTFNWPVKYCTIGKKIPNPEKRQDTLVREIHFDTLLRILRQTDWLKAPVYEQFDRNGRWKHDDDTVYSEIEIKYLISSLTKMVNDAKYEEFSKNEGVAIIEKHWDKTVVTL